MLTYYTIVLITCLSITSAHKACFDVKHDRDFPEVRYI